ncbi:MAG: Gfo/Idh/MocA family oxidoreductase [Mariniblastus sp.]|nr:Gfo/Idh/MocA family oxidoreductase [Mariniblastus sp.]MDG2180954.1 Gfo/Idh/MocA family oxidoreductase [Mariniblastus sp.]
MNSQTDSKMCRWGIMSTATIGQKNWQAINLSGNGTVAAVASRNLASSEKFINQLQASVPFDPAPLAVEGYQSLLDSPEIDAVYIPLPTGMRREWVIKAAEAGKHVLCEKPCASSYADLQEMVAACRNNNVQFMDGIMYMHGERLDSIRNAIDTKIGKIKRIATQFSFFGDQEFDEGNIRTNSELEPFGCLGDLGWYTIRFALWAMNYQLPKQVYGRMISAYKREDSPNSVPMEIECGMQFEDGVTSSFYNSFLTGHQQWAHVSGTEGSVYVPDFVLPFEGTEAKHSIYKPEFTVSDCDFAMVENREDVVVEEAGNSASNSQESNLFRNFAEIAMSGQTEDHWGEAALMTQRVMDACKKSAENGGVAIDLS